MENLICANGAKGSLGKPPIQEVGQTKCGRQSTTQPTIHFQIHSFFLKFRQLIQSRKAFSMFSRFLFIITAVFVITLSCSTSNQTANSISLDGHEAKNSLDWEGTYSGILPCASCPGILTDITLNKDQTFVLTQEYLEKQNTGQQLYFK